MQEAPKLDKSIYLAFFKENVDRIKKDTELTGDILLVERLEFGEHKTASGIIITAAPATNQLNAMTSDRPSFYRVLAVGNGFYDDNTKEDVPCEVQVGDIIQTGGLSVKLFSSIPLLQAYKSDSIGITRESDIQWRFKGEEAFIGFFEVFNRAVKEEVERRKEPR